MRSIRLEKIKKTKGGAPILSDLDLEIPSGQFFALLGPSGCGKTTLLRLIAGLESTDSGKIFLGNSDITNKPIHQRPINIVFQNYALFPHLNVFDNVAYSLNLKGLKPTEIAQKVEQLLRAFHLENHMYRSVKQLSGGQQQRVALARALVNEPDVLLLDEPLAALDFKLREKMLLELIDLQDIRKTTFIYVTHDQLEALTVADKMAIMNPLGEIEQIGTPNEIYEYPASPFVAQFVGTTNLITAAGQTTSLRPEKIMISKKKLKGYDVICEGIVEQIVYHGRSTQYNVRTGRGDLIRTFEQNEKHFALQEIDYEDKVFLHWQNDSVVTFDKA